ncbi:MAG TPA: metalloregulator ArsR/SmtB family transcription factor [Thermoplasmata archaeon]|nr:metalloregulator ArsR/SmtB family transcription factor [Thermoplasmata archaeon]HYB78701.1 metalloregulator ArsR/SmtB family transcription factor [Thermoplasmata archaeon]
MPPERSRPHRPSVDDRLDLLFYALSDTTRRALLARLVFGPANVTDLAKPFEMSLPAVSKHLKVLEQAHLVSRTVDGRVHRLALRGEPLRHVETWLDPFRTYWEGQLTALRRDLEAHPPRPRRRASGRH